MTYDEKIKKAEEIIEGLEKAEALSMDELPFTTTATSMMATSAAPNTRVLGEKISRKSAPVKLRVPVPQKPQPY